MNNKYSKLLTVILIIAIVGIVATIGYFVYDLYVVKTKKDKAQDVLEQFSSRSIQRETENKDKDNENNTGEVQNPESLLNTVETEIQTKENATSSEKVYMEGYEVMGTIQIPKTGVNLPILEKVTKKSLETSVAILYPEGAPLNQEGNITIAGHNYRNGLFFSDNKKLSKGDTIKITDQLGNTVTYEIYDTFITTPNDADYMVRDTQGRKEISLSTCTDDSSKRLIILAAEK